MRLLYIEASPRKDRSKSINVARTFLDAYQTAHSDHEVETLDLWTAEIPAFDGATINAKYRVMHGESQQSSEKAAWNRAGEIFDHFKSADKFVFSLPMWNFGIPYRLKHYIDVICQPGMAFKFDPATGYTGLVTGKPAVTIYARGGAYGGPADSPMDFQKPYLDFVLRFMGFTDIRPIVIEPTLASPEQVEQALAAASEAAKKLALEF